LCLSIYPQDLSHPFVVTVLTLLALDGIKEVDFPISKVATGRRVVKKQDRNVQRFSSGFIKSVY